MKNTNFRILTGGPGSGKSTILDLLKRKGYATVEETARNIIREQMRTNGDAVPWKNKAKYAHLMLSRAIADFETFLRSDRPRFFDRGIPDVLGYCRLAGIPVTDELQKAAETYRYNTEVFLFPFWKAIYINDTERKQTAEEAEHTGRVLQTTYEACGYRTIVVPFLPPEERAAWLIEHQ